MLFNSWLFVGLVIVTAIIYYLPFFRQKQAYVLLAASFVFYAYDNLGLLVLLILSGLINAFASYGAIYGNRPRLSSAIGVSVNLLILALFKYGGLISSSFMKPDEGIGEFLCNIPLPLGISFYTFSGISLVVDSYRGRYDEEWKSSVQSFPKHLKKTLLYICFFPKLLAGPIAKSKDFMGEIKPKVLKEIDKSFIFKSLIVGYFLKMVISDNLKDYTFWMEAPVYFESYSTSGLIWMLYGYSIQMFADFAGYSLIAIGVAAIFGYKLPTNFNFPYISSSFREFWKRWHITLSQFLMEYLYISLGGNRKGKIRTYLNLLITMMLGGLWHGAAWSYLVWGTYHGICLVIERMVCGRRDNCIHLGSSSLLKSLSHIVSIIFVFISVSLGWLLFKLPHFEDAISYIKCIFTNYDLPGVAIHEWILIYTIPVILYHLLYYFRESTWVQKYIFRFSYVLYGVMLFFIATNSGSASSFVYFQF